jgi:hypothetical protein
VTGVPHRTDFSYAVAWSHGSAVRFAKLARIALLGDSTGRLGCEVPQRADRGANLPIRGLPPRSQHRGQAGTRRRGRVRPGSAPPKGRGHERDTTGRIPGTAPVVRGGPGESRGLCLLSFLECCIGANFDNQNKTLLCYPGILVFGIRTMLRRAPPIFCMVLRAYCDRIETKIHLAGSRFVPAPRLFLRHPKTLAHRTTPPTTPGQ